MTCPGSSRRMEAVARGSSAAARGPEEARGASADAPLPPCHPAGIEGGAAEVLRGSRGRSLGLEAARGVMEVSRGVMEVSRGVMEVSRGVMEVYRGMVEVSRGVVETKRL